MGTWDQGSLGEMRTSTLLNMLQRGIGLPVTWLPLNKHPWAVEVIREKELDLYRTPDLDEVYGIAFRECLQSVIWQVRQDCEEYGSLVVDAPSRWRWMYGQGVVGPVRVGLIRDYSNLQVRVGIRVLGIPYMLEGATVHEVRQTEQVTLKVGIEV